MINNDSNLITIYLTAKKLLIVILSLQLAIFGLTLLGKLGLEIPVLRQVIGFLYLTFIPGILLIVIFGISNLNLTEVILYSVGLSLSFLMYIGALASFLYPFISIQKPISETPLIYTISFTVVLLCIIFYQQNKKFELLLPNLRDFLSPSTLLFVLPIFLAVFGAYLLRFHESNFLLLILIALISLIPFLAIYHVSSKFYPLLIFSIALSLLLYASAASPYVRGWDACVELYTANLVKANSLWDLGIPTAQNAMLSIVILRPIYSILLGISLTEAFTLTSPFLFSLVPVVLYEISRRVVKSQSRDEIAFLSCSFFMFFWMFYTSMANLYRQQIAMLFLSLIILLLTDREMKTSIGKKVLLIIFSISLVVSHYATAYLYMFILLAALLLSALKPLRKLFSFESISSNYIALFIAIIITWYIYTSGGTLFNALVNIGNNIISAVSTEFLNPEHTGMFWVKRELPSISYKIVRLLHYITALFVIVGFLDCLRTLLKGKKSMIEEEHLSFSAILLGILAVMMAVPYASPIGLARTYQIFLLWLAPLCIAGGLAIVRAFKLPTEYGLRLLAVFFAIFLLFNSGFIPEINGEYQYNSSLAKAHINDRDFDTKVSFYSSTYTEKEIFAAKWLSDNRELEFKVYADGFHSLLYGYAEIPMWKGLPPKGSETVYTLTKDTLVDENSYIYLRQINLAGVMLLKEPKKGKIAGKIDWWNTPDLDLNIMNKIYINSGSAIYYR